MRAIILGQDVLERADVESEQEVTVRGQPPVDARALLHRRDRRGMASCGLPARQDQLTDDMEFECVSCWAAIQRGGGS